MNKKIVKLKQKINKNRKIKSINFLKLDLMKNALCFIKYQKLKSKRKL